MSEEKVNHPSHYNQGRIEVIDFIEDQGLGFSLGNAVKYIARAEHKGNDVNDLEKARWYIEREIERRQGTLITTTRKNIVADCCNPLKQELENRPLIQPKKADEENQPKEGPNINWSKVPMDVELLGVRSGLTGTYLTDATDSIPGDQITGRWDADRDIFPDMDSYVGCCFRRPEEEIPPLNTKGWRTVIPESDSDVTPIINWDLIPGFVDRIKVCGPTRSGGHCFLRDVHTDNCVFGDGFEDDLDAFPNINYFAGKVFKRLLPKVKSQLAAFGSYPEVHWDKIPKHVKRFTVREGKDHFYLFNTQTDDYVFRPHSWDADAAVFPNMGKFLGVEFIRDAVDNTTDERGTADG